MQRFYYILSGRFLLLSVITNLDETDNVSGLTRLAHNQDSLVPATLELTLAIH